MANPDTVPESGEEPDWFDDQPPPSVPQTTTPPVIPPNDRDAPAPADTYGPLNVAYGGSLPEIGTYPAFAYDPFNAPSPFAPPSGQSVLDNDPGYDFRLGQGRQALEQSAAARGVLNTGGTLQDLIDYGQSFASNEYDNAYQRALGTYQTNFNDALNAYITNFGGALTKYNTNYGTQYLTPYNQLMEQYGIRNSNYQNAQDRSFGQQFAVATA